MKVTQVLLFEVPNTGTGFSADVQIDGAFSIQLGCDNEWTFPPDAGLRQESAQEVAAQVGAFEAVQTAIENGQAFE